MNKKAQALSLQTIAIAIIVLAVVIISIAIFYQGSGTAGKEVSIRGRQISFQSCETKGLSRNIFDNDFGKDQGDGFPDSCDVCLGGDDSIDSDDDYIPDACDDEPKKPAKKANMVEICKDKKGLWNKDLNHCKLNCYDKGTCPR